MIGDGDRDVRLVATLRGPEFDRLVAPADSSEAARGTGRDARDVLGLASVVELPRRWSDAEPARARGYDDDPRISGAVRRAGNTMASLALLEELRSDHERVYGRDHHDTILTSHYIGSFLAEERPAEALAVLTAVRDAYTRLLGADHSRVPQARTLIAQITGCDGDAARAGWAPGAPPRGAALVAAATWTFRAGEHEAAGEQLRRLTADVGDESLLHAVRTSSERVHERIGIGLLQARAGAGRVPAGYLGGRAAAVVARITSSGANTSS